MQQPERNNKLATLKIMKAITFGIETIRRENNLWAGGHKN